VESCKKIWEKQYQYNAGIIGTYLHSKTTMSIHLKGRIPLIFKIKCNDLGRLYVSLLNDDIHYVTIIRMMQS
jgi:hypothetical protein